MIFFEFYHKDVFALFCNKLICNIIQGLIGKIFFEKKNEGCISL